MDNPLQSVTTELSATTQSTYSPLSSSTLSSPDSWHTDQMAATSGGPPVAELVVVAIVLIPTLWILQARTVKIISNVGLQTLALVGFAVLGPLVLDLLPGEHLDYQMRLVAVLLIEGLTLPSLIWLARWSFQTREPKPLSKRTMSPRASSKNYSNRRKRAGY